MRLLPQVKWRNNQKHTLPRIKCFLDKKKREKTRSMYRQRAPFQVLREEATLGKFWQEDPSSKFRIMWPFCVLVLAASHNISPSVKRGLGLLTVPESLWEVPCRPSLGSPESSVETKPRLGVAHSALQGRGGVHQRAPSDSSME